jgi:hypothetical protein
VLREAGRNEMDGTREITDVDLGGRRKRKCDCCQIGFPFKGSIAATVSTLKDFPSENYWRRKRRQLLAPSPATCFVARPVASKEETHQTALDRSKGTSRNVSLAIIVRSYVNQEQTFRLSANDAIS